MLSELEGRGWVMVEPPAKNDGDSVIARYNGDKIRAGFLLDIVEDTEEVVHRRYRSGKFDLDVKVDFDIGRGQVRVKRAEGYDE